MNSLREVFKPNGKKLTAFFIAFCFLFFASFIAGITYTTLADPCYPGPHYDIAKDILLSTVFLPVLIAISISLGLGGASGFGFVIFPVILFVGTAIFSYFWTCIGFFFYEKYPKLVKGLLIVAVLAFAVMFFISMTQKCSGGGRNRSRLSQDKSVCAARGVELLNYTHIYSSDQLSELRQDLSVRYEGEKKECGRETLLEHNQSSCRIFVDDEYGSCFEITVKNGTDGCYVSYEKDCW